MVIEDKNKDGEFNDNIPDGLVDPFGWQSKEADPWELFSFSYSGIQRTGNKSYYLWKKKLDGLDAAIPANGGVFNTGKYSAELSEGTVPEGSTLEIKAAPSAKISETVESVGSVMDVILKDPLGSLITILTKPMLITIDFTQADLTRFKLGSLSIYSSTDRENWTKEDSFTDFLNKKASAQVNHLTYFALMGERLDTTPPATVSGLQGEKGQPNWFRSDTQLTFNAADNDGGLGVKYTAYKLDNADWQKYTEPLMFTTEGHQRIEYYSEDNDGNIEDVQSIEFDIDKTLPEISINASPSTLWPPNGKMRDVKITGNSTDENMKITKFEVIDEYESIEPVITNFSQTIQLEAKRNGNDKDGRKYSIKATAEDKAGNIKEAVATVLVPHDQGK